MIFEWHNLQEVKTNFGQSKYRYKSGIYRLGIFPVCPTLPMVHWDGMDSKDTGMRVVQVGNSPSLSYSFSKVHLGINRYSKWDRSGCSHFDPSGTLPACVKGFR